MSRSQVANTLRLLELPADMQEAVARGRITLGHAKVLLSLDDAEERRLLFEKVAEENLSVRDLEGARESLERERPPSAKGRKRGEARKRKAPQIVSLEEEFSEKLGTRVTVHEGRGKGRIVIEFYSRDDFDRLRELLLGGGPR
jgi:ParB family chromosome partitioning protein